MTDKDSMQCEALRRCRDLSVNQIDAIINMSMKEFAKLLIKKNIFRDEKAIKLFVLEYLQVYFTKDDQWDWPIAYYSDDEPVDPITKEEEGENICDFQQETFKVNE